MVTSLATQPPDHVPETAAPVTPEPEQPNPVEVVVRAMRGRWLVAAAVAAVLGPVLGFLGFLSGTQLFQSSAILRVYPQESNILYATGNGSVLKTFNSFVKAETSYVASHPVMSRAVETISATETELAEELKVSDLTRSVSVRQSDSLIVLTTMSRDASFAKAKLDAVVNAYLGLKSETEKARSLVRLNELREREDTLSQRLASMRMRQLDVGREFGIDAIPKAHIQKIAQIEALSARRAEVAATLANLERKSSGAPADVSDQKIMRAILLDRGLADLNFDRVKKNAELANLRSRIGEKMPALRHKQEEITVLEVAIAERREQIRILAQTGALTDTSEKAAEASTGELKRLFDKVSDQLEGARSEARDLNRRRIELNAISKDIEENQKLLAETRQALEVIRLESGRALPGYTVLMSPPSLPLDPSEDTRRLLAAGGLGGGLFAGLALALALGFGERRLRYAETLAPHSHRLPVVQVSPADPQDTFAADRLRNELQLLPLRGERPVGRPPVLAITRTDPGSTGAVSLALAKSYARARMRTLYIDADLNVDCADDIRPGWRELLAVLPAEGVAAGDDGMLFVLPPGRTPEIRDDTISVRAVRQAIERASWGFDVVVISAGSLEDRLASGFVLSVADVAVAAFFPSDTRKNLNRHLERLESLPRYGSVAVFRNALASDPWVGVRS